MNTAACPFHSTHGLYGAEQWERSKVYDSDYTAPIESGAAVLYRCPIAYGYHLLPVAPVPFNTGLRTPEDVRSAITKAKESK